MSAKKFNATDIARTIAAETGLSQRDARRALTAMVGAVAGALRSGHKVTIVGLGNFEVKTRRIAGGTREVFGKTVTVKGGTRKKLAFRAAKAFKVAARVVKEDGT